MKAITKVEMLVGGRRALVDSDQVTKVARKQALVAEARMYQNDGNLQALDEVMGKIVRLNRTIRQNIRFLPLEK